MQFLSCCVPILFPAAADELKETWCCRDSPLAILFPAADDELKETWCYTDSLAQAQF